MYNMNVNPFGANTLPSSNNNYFDYNKKYYKFTNPDENHRGYQYQDGLNIDNQPLNFSKESCSGGGLYFTEFKNLPIFYDFMKSGGFLREVFVPKDEPVVKENGIGYHNSKYKSNKIILGKKMPLNSDDTINFLFDNLIDNQIKNKIIINPLLMTEIERKQYNKLLPFINKIKYKLCYSNDPIKKQIGYNHLYNDDVYKLTQDMYEFLEKDDINKQMKEITNNKYNHTLDNLIYSCIRTKRYKFFDYLEEYIKTCEHPVSLASSYSIKPLSFKQTAELLNTKLKDDIGYDMFDFLLKRNFVVAGSYVLHAMYGPRIKANDIDIYINCKYYVETKLYLKEYIKSFKFAYTNHKSLYNLDGIKHMINVDIRSKYESNDCNIKIQLMFVDDQYGLPYFIKNNFDFSICQIWYDGYNVYSTQTEKEYNEDIGHVNPKYVEDCDLNVINRFRIVYRVCNTMARYFKYVNRGFKIYDIESIIKVLKEIKCKTPEELFSD